MMVHAVNQSHFNWPPGEFFRCCKSTKSPTDNSDMWHRGGGTRLALNCLWFADILLLCNHGALLYCQYGLDQPIIAFLVAAPASPRRHFVERLAQPHPRQMRSGATCQGVHRAAICPPGTGKPVRFVPLGR